MMIISPEHTWGVNPIVDMTQITPKAAALLADTLLIDRVAVYRLQPATVTRYSSSRTRELVSSQVRSLVQATSTDVAEGLGDGTYSVKLPTTTEVQPGMLLVVTMCTREPSLVGMELMVDSISEDGLSIIRKCIAHSYTTVDHQGV